MYRNKAVFFLLVIRLGVLNCRLCSGRKKRLFHKLYHGVIVICAWHTVWTFSLHFRAFREVLKIRSGSYLPWPARVMQSMMVREKQINNFDQTCSWLHNAIDLLLNSPSPLIRSPFLTSIKPLLWPWPAQMTNSPNRASSGQWSGQQPLTLPKIKRLKFNCQEILLKDILIISKLLEAYEETLPCDVRWILSSKRSESTTIKTNALCSITIVTLNNQIHKTALL